MTISVDEPDPVPVPIEGRSNPIDTAGRCGWRPRRELTERQIEEQVAAFDTAVSELGG